MTSERIDLPARTGSQRQVLLAFLGEHRRILRETVLLVLTDVQARRRLVPSLTTPMGLLQSRGVRRDRVVPLPLRRDDPRGRRHPPERRRELHPGRRRHAQGAHRALEVAVARADRVIGGLDLDDTCEHPAMGTLSLRWGLAHCIRELAQHAGHAQILVEQIRASPASPRPRERPTAYPHSAVTTPCSSPAESESLRRGSCVAGSLRLSGSSGWSTARSPRYGGSTGGQTGCLSRVRGG